MEYRQSDCAESPLLSDITLGGTTAALCRTFFEKRFFSDHAKNVIFMEAENAFRMQIDGAKPAGLWQGEFWGKHVLSAVEVCRYTGDESLKQFLHSAALRLLSLAREDGYLNTYADSLNVFPPKPVRRNFCGTGISGAASTRFGD